MALETPKDVLTSSEATASGETTEASHAPRWGAFGVGLALSALIAVVTPYNEMIVKGSRLGLSSLTPVAFFLFFIWGFWRSIRRSTP